MSETTINKTPYGYEKGIAFSVVERALSVPGIRVDRNVFLREQFSNLDSASINEIIEKGPVAVGCSRLDLKNRAESIISIEKWAAASISFSIGLNEKKYRNIGLVGDLIQQYSSVIRLAQKLAYLYGAKDLWEDTARLKSKSIDQIILYLGTMMGLSVASSAVRFVFFGLSKSVSKDIMNKALSDSFIYKVVDWIASAIDEKMTKERFAAGVKTGINIVGSLSAALITFLSIRNMAQKLVCVLDEGNFSYSEERIEQDYSVLRGINTESE